MTADAPEPTAGPDPVTRLMLAEAGVLGATVLVIDDAGGELARAALDSGARVLAHCDDLRDEAALPPGVEVLDWLEPTSALGEVDTVLWRLPRSLDAVSEVCEILARACPARVRIVAGGRDKHLTPTMNPVMARSFTHVRASLGRWKCRVLHASGPIDREPTWPRRTRLTALGLDLVSSGAAFASGRLDAGTALLARHLPAGTGLAVDAGCGTGVLAVLLARQGWRVVASDVSQAAVRATLATAAANGVADRVEVGRWAGVRTEAHPVDLVVSNPPFHRGAAKDSAAAFEIVDGASAALAPGGELRLVFNAHLPYLPYARRVVGPTRILARTRDYLVTCSTRS